MERREDTLDSVSGLESPVKKHLLGEEGPQGNSTPDILRPFPYCLTQKRPLTGWEMTAAVFMADHMPQVRGDIPALTASSTQSLQMNTLERLRYSSSVIKAAEMRTAKLDASTDINILKGQTEYGCGRRNVKQCPVNLF